MAETVNFAGIECLVDVLTYANGGAALRLVDAKNFEPVATATSWIPGLDIGEVAIKNYSENEGMLEALLDASIITRPHRIEIIREIRWPIAYLSPEKGEEDIGRRNHHEHEFVTAIEVEDREHKRQVICPECGFLIHELEPSWYEDFENGERRESHVWMPTSRCCSEPCGQSQYCVSYITFYGQPCYA